MQICKHRVSRNQSVSTCSDRAISSEHAGHYLTLLWYSEGNLREARARLWLTPEEGKCKSKRAFSSTSPLNINSETVCRPTGASESFCPEHGRSSGERGETRLIMFVKVQPHKTSRPFTSYPGTSVKANWGKQPAAALSDTQPYHVLIITQLSLWQTY